MKNILIILALLLAGGMLLSISDWSMSDGSMPGWLTPWSTDTSQQDNDRVPQQSGSASRLASSDPNQPGDDAELVQQRQQRDNAADQARRLAGNSRNQATSNPASMAAPPLPPTVSVDAAAEYLSDRSGVAEDDALIDAAADEDELAHGSISGRVMDDLGEPLAGVSVLATRQPDGRSVPGTTVLRYETSSSVEGWFEFVDIPAGDYIINARDHISGASSNSVRTGTGTPLLDLLIPMLHPVVLFGAVSDAQGTPIIGARVMLAPSAFSSNSDDLGVYLLQAELRGQQNYQLNVQKSGYRDARVALPEQDWRDTPELQLDVQMQRESEQAAVSGVVVDEDGNPVAGATLYLQNQTDTYQAQSDAAGRFRFDQVVAATSYTLLVQTQSGFANYQQTGLEVPTNGRQGLQIVLQRLADGTVQGQFVDPFGNPLPAFSSNLMVDRFRVAVVADAFGRFELEKVPAGDLQLRTSGSDLLVTRGAQLQPEQQLQVVAVADVGTGQFVGTVRDYTGAAVAGARLTLAWSLHAQGLQHESSRQAIADANGRFAFTGYAAVDHSLRIQADGLQTLTVGIAAAMSSNEFNLQPVP